MNLPDMLRAENPMCERRSATPEEWQKNGKWTLYPIGPELAALVEAADAGDVEAYKAARAALEAKIGGSK